MAFLSGDEKQRIAQAIEQVERRTRGELVTVIARAADDYYYIPTLWAALAALLVPGLMAIADLTAPVDPYALQIGVFLVLAALFRIPALKLRLVPDAVKKQRAQRLAREQFLLQGLHHTSGATGVLLFVSVAEHYVEIIADRGINDAVPPGSWNQIVAAFVDDVKKGRVGEGFTRAVHSCGALLADHFPVQPGDTNELPNRLVEL